MSPFTLLLDIREQTPLMAKLPLPVMTLLEIIAALAPVTSIAGTVDKPGS